MVYSLAQHKEMTALLGPMHKLYLHGHFGTPIAC